jgi:two-component system cell cycle sensor histidine kinase/response regulator CckA
MTADIQKKIFDPFFTTKEMGKGTGLGLSTVFGIVQQNDGFINVYSEPQLGATFRIYLRRYLGENSPDASGEVLDQTHHGKGQILVVEDDEILREVIPQILDRLGYTFIMADTPDDAMQLCYRSEIEIDVLLTDVVMPGMSGKELWERFSIVRPHTKVIYMSGYTADVISRQGVLDSGVHFIQKPFSTLDLGKKLLSVMESQGTD